MKTMISHWITQLVSDRNKNTSSPANIVHFIITHAFVIDVFHSAVIWNTFSPVHDATPTLTFPDPINTANVRVPSLATLYTTQPNNEPGGPP
jgi:hypothetical protein